MDYLESAIRLLQEIRETEQAAIEAAAQALAAAIQADHLVYVFGSAHAGLLAQELFYRAGGLVPINPILPPGLTTDVRPITLTSRLERLPGLGAQLAAESPIAAGDVVIVHSVSGRNAVVVEFAQAARQRGATVIAVTSLDVFARGGPAPARPAAPVRDRRPGAGRSRPIGDALIALPGLPQRVGPISTVTGAAILNAVVVRAAELLLQRTGDAPVLLSANLDGGDEHNQRWLKHYQGRLTYL